MSGAEPGWRTVRLGRVTDLDSFYDEVSRALGLPEWFGRNLDALWEMLMELDQPTRLELSDTESFSVHHPRSWSRVQDLLRDRAEQPADQAVPFVVVSPPRRE